VHRVPLAGHVYTSPGGVTGFDADRHITAEVAVAFQRHGYQFCVRYVRRDTVNPHDITHDEAAGLLEAGLGLMVVQHVAPAPWTPTADLGAAYGATAATEAHHLGLPSGVTVWCDLEGVAAGTPEKQVIDFCNRWHSEAASAGFVPGLYVGDSPGLGPTQLYRSLRFVHYWSAYNLNDDALPAVRGVQMKQRRAGKADVVTGHRLEFQVDIVHADALGGLPTLLAPAEWPA
jgi:hypothetical protein